MTRLQSLGPKLEFQFQDPADEIGTNEHLEVKGFLKGFQAEHACLTGTLSIDNQEFTKEMTIDSISTAFPEQPNVTFKWNVRNVEVEDGIYDIDVNIDSCPEESITIDPQQIYLQDVMIDTTPPELTITMEKDDGSSDGGEQTYQPVTIHASAVDQLSGFNQIEYSMDNKESWETYDGPITIDDNGEYMIYMKAADQLGNIVEDSVSVHLFSTEPSIDIVNNGENQYGNSDTPFTIPVKVWNPGSEKVTVTATAGGVTKEEEIDPPSEKPAVPM